MTSSPASFGFSCWTDLTPVMSTAHQHNDIEFNFSESDLSYLIGGERVLVPAGRATAFWGSTPHQLVQADERALVTWLTVPLELFLSWRVPTAVKRQLLGGGVLSAPAAWSEVEAPRRFAQWQHDLGRPVAGGTPTSLESVLAELEAEAFACRFALEATQTWSSTEPQGVSVVPDRDGTATVRRAGDMAEWIAENYHRDIRVAQVAAVAHVHPHYASALFSRVFGVSIRSYLQQFRIGEAQRRLVTTDEPISSIVAATGFGSQSAFYECFTRACGMPPAKYRLRHSGGSV